MTDLEMRIQLEEMIVVLRENYMKYHYPKHPEMLDMLADTQRKLDALKFGAEPQ